MTLTHPRAARRSASELSVAPLFGRRTWAFPRWADRRLPRLAIEPAFEPVAALDEAA